MDKIASSEVTKDQVVQISRDMLRESYDLDGRAQARARRDHLGGHGPGPDPRAVPEVPRRRAQERGGRTPTASRSSAPRSRGKRFVGCEGYPDCDQTYGIPQRGELIRLEENCSICGETPRLKVWTGRRPWNLCLNEECPSMVEMRAQRAEREAARAAKEAAAAAAADGDGTADGAGAEGDGAADAKKPAKPAPAKRRRAPART